MSRKRRVRGCAAEAREGHPPGRHGIARRVDDVACLKHEARRDRRIGAAEGGVEVREPVGIGHGVVVQQRDGLVIAREGPADPHVHAPGEPQVLGLDVQHERREILRMRRGSGLCPRIVRISRHVQNLETLADASGVVAGGSVVDHQHVEPVVGLAGKRIEAFEGIGEAIPVQNDDERAHHVRDPSVSDDTMRVGVRDPIPGASGSALRAAGPHPARSHRFREIASNWVLARGKGETSRTADGGSGAPLSGVSASPLPRDRIEFGTISREG
jgi:hypothetical protein